jgi:transposase InsO family protein
LVAEEATIYPVTMMCRVLHLNRASYYRWRARQTGPPTARQQRHQQVTAAILARFAAAHERIGRRPMRHLLAQDQIRCSPGLVHRIMAEQGLQARRRRAWKRTTRRDPAARTAHITNRCRDEHGQRSFHSDRPGAVTVGDITYLPTREGWLYLAVVLDLATRTVIGWAMRPTLHTEVAQAALAMAHQHGRLRSGAIFHSDRGTQYTSQAFQDHCADVRVTQSMGATGVCWDNAVAESFFATLKCDLVAEEGTFATRQAARAWVVRYIEGWYNRRRPHQFNNGVPPLVAWHQHSVQLPVSLS